MEIKTLDWDSDFFGYKVGKLVLPEGITSLETLPDNIKDFALIYLFSDKPVQYLPGAETLPAPADVKVLWGKTIQDRPTLHESIKPIHEANERLIELALQSGAYSRYKLDKKFINHEFERMYTLWVNKAVADDNQQVLGYYEGTALAGFITLSVKNEAADIGLIAVDTQFRGKKMGSKLLDAAEIFALESALNTVEVNTQKANEVAMHFYRQNGYNVLKETYIYHLWN